MSHSKLCLVYNYAQHYRKKIFQLLDRELNCDFYFGDKMDDVKKLDYSLLKNFKGELINKKIGNSLYYQQGISNILRQKYEKYIFLGDARCLSTWRALIQLKLSGRRIYLWTHGWYGKETWLERILKKIFFKMADGIFLYGNYAKRLMIKEGFNPEKLFVIHNSLDYEYHLSILQKIKETDIYQQHFKNNNPNLIFIGRLTTVKKINQLIEAIRILDEKNVNCNLTLIGDGVEKEHLKELVERYHIADRVWFYGACYDDLKNSELIYNANLCVAPGNVGLTAMHCMTFGTPVISHNCFSMQMPEFEAIVPHHTGDFFTYGDVESLAETINCWLSNHNLDRKQVREACYNEIKKNWNPLVQIETFSNVFCKQYS